MKVEQFLNRNQFHLYDDTNDIFQSYDSQICIIRKDCEEVILGKDWDYSTTTSKHLYAFLDEYLYSDMEDMNGNNIKYELRNSSNKRAYIQKLIDNNIFLYDEEMR
jgi:hypothetical protein